MSAYLLNLQYADGTMAVLNVAVASTPPWKLTVSGGGFEGQEFEGDDLFGAMTALRRKLEKRGISLQCAGARKDVYPSGMSRSMGSARNAYVTTLGEPAIFLVDIFDPAGAEQVGTVSEQKQHREKWAASLREKLGA